MGAVWAKDNGRFGYRKSSKNLFQKIKSVRRYDNGWTGNRYYKTLSPKPVGNVLGKLSWAGNIAIGGYNIREGYVADGHMVGYNTKKAGLTTTTSIGGAIAGAEAGAAIGVWIGGWGAIPGGIIGGIGGGLLGNEFGEFVSCLLYTSDAADE